MKKKTIAVVGESMARMILESAMRQAPADNNLFEISCHNTEDDVPALDLREERRQKKFAHRKKRELFSLKHSKISRNNLRSGRHFRQNRR